MRPNVNTQTALTLPGPIPLQKGVGPGNEATPARVVPPLLCTAKPGGVSIIFNPTRARAYRITIKACL